MYQQGNIHTNTSRTLKKENPDINEIIRGEISAKEAYTQVLIALSSDPEAYRLRQLMLDHENGVHFWKRQARVSGNVPQDSSSIWGLAVEAFVGVSKIIGEKTALEALKKGEEYGLSSYQKMLQSKLLNQFEKKEIEDTFIPRQRRHVAIIEAMIEVKN